jgi:two-component system sensor histidine kinase RegB
MGLGLFIAKTMLERTGAELTFTNGTPDGYQLNNQSRTMQVMKEATGAIVNVRWARKDIEVKQSGGFGENQHIPIT